MHPLSSTHQPRPNLQLLHWYARELLHCIFLQVDALAEVNERLGREGAETGRQAQAEALRCANLQAQVATLEASLAVTNQERTSTEASLRSSLEEAEGHVQELLQVRQGR